MQKKSFFVGGLLALALTLAVPVLGTATTPEEPALFSTEEMDKFITDYPKLRDWVADQGWGRSAGKSPWILSGMRYNKKFENLLKEKGWDADRFYYTLNHVRTGLRLIQVEAFKQQRDFPSGAKDLETLRNEAKKRLDEQQSAQRKQIENNPNIPPYQKQMWLNQMGRSWGGAAQPSWADWMKSQFEARKAADKWMVQNNPYIPPEAKNQILAQIDQQVIPAAWNPPKDSAEMMERMIAQRESELNNQKNQIQNNPTLSPEQKKQMITTLDKSFEEMKKGATKKSEPLYLIPPEELELVKKNQNKLESIFGENNDEG
ncbi:MAG: hypothetical protein H7832_03170 [Magnetococcus sp. DMHC-6]